MAGLSFLAAHFVQWMDAYKDGRSNKALAEDFSFNLAAATCDEQVVAVYCVINDLDCEEWVPELLKQYRKLRATEPPPTPSNIELGTN